MKKIVKKKPTENFSVKSQPTVEAIKASIEYHLRYSLGKVNREIEPHDYYVAVGYTVREMLIDGMENTQKRFDQSDVKNVYYLSMEFLLGRLLENNLSSLMLHDVFDQALESLGVVPNDVFDSEHDPALGNGGLGRLAACFLDSIATLGISGYGYGINYEYGLFKQKIVNGWQKEKPDHWVIEGTPWQIERTDEAVLIPVYGRLEHITDRQGNYTPAWVDWQLLVGVPYDMPIAGFGAKTVNYLRLYSARASEDFDVGIFNQGDYIEAVGQKIASENVSKVLYPNDSFDAGKELRLIQEYFFVACALRDIIKKHLAKYPDFTNLAEKNAIQLNDTHPALAVVELMRIMVDEHGIKWEDAWGITQSTMAYTNHTLLPEALEKWPVSLLVKVIPRHMQIIYEINHRFLELVKETVKLDELKDTDKFLGSVSILEESCHKQVRMANLAIVGSHSVNGVAALHSELVKTQLVPNFYKIWPNKFNNKTNGITPRRWLLQSNKALSSLVTSKIGSQWITHLDELKKIESYADDPNFIKSFREIKLENKRRLSALIKKTTNIDVDPSSLFDIQAKRIHEYKRQLLSVMHIIHEYLTIKEDAVFQGPPRTYIFSGKAAPGYRMAKLYIKLINNLSKTINNDPDVKDHIKVVFLPDFKVSIAEHIYPAADLSEQVSTAGFEASGTGNMKFALNGALTIGTLDGANVEIKEEVGDDNIFIFGLRSEEILAQRSTNEYNPWDFYDESPSVKRVVDTFASDLFCPHETGLFKPIFDTLMYQGDYYFHLADFDSYLEAQALASKTYLQPDEWAKKAILNVARVGKFSSDRTIAEYARDIWEVEIEQ